ncbi:hypothetical protein BDD12DRAFT_880693 [Trichophaea hybrida]|nr:hypothetical protein BDD12DRAFT_880693 [Trichophaea hybrida]
MDSTEEEEWDEDAEEEDNDDEILESESESGGDSELEDVIVVRRGNVLNRPVRPRFLQDGRDGAKAVRLRPYSRRTDVGRHPPSSGGYCFGINEILGAEGVIFGETESEMVWMEQMLTDLASRSE